MTNTVVNTFWKVQVGHARVMHNFKDFNDAKTYAKTRTNDVKDKGLFLRGLPVEIRDEIRLVNQDFAAQSLSCPHTRQLALRDQDADGMFRQPADDIRAFPYRQHLDSLIGLFRFLCICKLRNQRHNLGYKLFFCLHLINPPFGFKLARLQDCNSYKSCNVAGFLTAAILQCCILALRQCPVPAVRFLDRLHAKNLFGFVQRSLGDAAVSCLCENQPLRNLRSAGEL